MIFFITLITGTPGAGKTLWTVAELVKLYYPKLQFFQALIALFTGKKLPPLTRKLYVHGIPNLDFGVPFTKIYCRSPLCDVCSREIEEATRQRDAVLYVENYPQWAEHGSLMVIDEVQRIWRPRPAGSAVPSEISALETHRHSGIDFILISQSGKLLDSNIRRLVNRHIHLVANWRGRTQYEWAEYKDNTSSTADAVTRPYVLKKNLFQLYKSASVHTTINKRLPVAIYIVAIAALVLAWLGYDIYKRYRADVAAVEAPANEIPAKLPEPVPSHLNNAVQTVIPVKNAPGSVDFTPRTPGRPETAPAYDGVLKVQSVPFPEQCLAWTTEAGQYCKCLTDQGTPYEMPYNVCVAYAKGQVYNPYKKPSPPPPVPADVKPETQPIQVAATQKTKS